MLLSFNTVGSDELHTRGDNDWQRIALPATASGPWLFSNSHGGRGSGQWRGVVMESAFRTVDLVVVIVVKVVVVV